MIFEVSENKIKILDILFSEKLQIYTSKYVSTKPTLKTVCKVHALDYWDKALKVSHNQANVHNVNNRKSFI